MPMHMFDNIDIDERCKEKKMSLIKYFYLKKKKKNLLERTAPDHRPKRIDHISQIKRADKKATNEP